MNFFNIIVSTLFAFSAQAHYPEANVQLAEIAKDGVYSNGHYALIELPKDGIPSIVVMDDSVQANEAAARWENTARIVEAEAVTTESPRSLRGLFGF